MTLADDDSRVELERVFERYVEAARDAEHAPDMQPFLDQAPDSVREELRLMIGDWQALVPRFATDDGDEARQDSGYRLLQELGRGGMGVVHEAEEIASGHRVALKLLTADLQYSDEAYDRFEREARLAASISHPRCVFVLGAVEFEGRPAIIMELMSGGTLQTVIDTGQPIPVDQAVEWMLDVIEGLEAAQHAGIIHRDVKPPNCFLTPAGRVKIGDFGISRTLEMDTRLTHTGQFLGSPLYAPPEQVRGDPTDMRTDIYSVGATLFALLTSRPPFSGRGLGQILARILSDPVPSARALRPDVPRGLDRVLRRTLAKKPAHRFPSYAELRHALRPYVKHRRRGVHVRRRLRAYLLDLAVVALALLGLAEVAGTAGWLVTTTPSGMPDARTWAVVMVPACILYFGVMEGLFGAGLGKWLVGQRVVAPDGEVSPGRGLLRALLFGVAPALALLLITLGDPGLPLLLLGLLGAGLLPYATMRARHGSRGLHEVLSGTRVVRVPAPVDRGQGAQVLRIVRERDDACPQRIGRFVITGDVGPSVHGRWFEAYDSRLERPVFVHRNRKGRDVLPRRPASPTVDRPLPLQWIEGGRDAEGHSFEVYESPEGASLAEAVAADHVMSWSLTLAALEDLAEDLASGLPSATCLESLWVDGQGRLRALPHALGTERPPELDAAELVGAVARSLLHADRDPAEHLPEGLPASAEPVVSRLVGLAAPYERLSLVRRALADLEGRPTRVLRRRRALQLALPATGLVLAWGGLTMQVEQADPQLESLIAAGVLLCAWLGGVLGAALFRGGIWLAMAGLAVRDRRGRLASRGVCALRAAVCWGPSALIAGLVVLPSTAQTPTWLLDLSLSLSVVLLLAGAVSSIVRPAGGLADRLLGTRIVPY